jgi:transcriptional regulator with XRE-family HTH domain
MSQSTLAEALGLTFQQVQKYEKGANRIGAGRLQQIAQILQMPVESFFEGLPHERSQRRVSTDAPDLQYVADYLATADGLQLTKAFMQIPNAKLRRSIVNLVEQLANSEDQWIQRRGNLGGLTSRSGRPKSGGHDSAITTPRHPRSRPVPW